MTGLRSAAQAVVDVFEQPHHLGYAVSPRTGAYDASQPMVKREWLDTMEDATAALSAALDAAPPAGLREAAQSLRQSFGAAFPAGSAHTGYATFMTQERVVALNDVESFLFTLSYGKSIDGIAAPSCGHSIDAARLDRAICDHQHDPDAPLSIRRDHMQLVTFRSCAAAIAAAYAGGGEP